MRSIMRAVAVFACVAVSFLYGPPLARATEPTSADTPEQLVRAALESEVTGASDERARLLAEALARDPNFAPARWHSGFVRIGDEWIQIDDVPGRVGNDPPLAVYRQKRDALVDTADNHRELARWCRKNRLNDEERVHWAKVLEFNSQDAEALAALGLQLYEGRLMTRAQIEKAKVAAGERMRAMRKWQPQLLKWRAAIERGVPKRLDEALRGLNELSDPEALGALETVFGMSADSERTNRLNLLLIEVADRIHHPETTQVLLRRAVNADSTDVRLAACEALKRRPMHAYVPLLIEAMPGSLSTKFHIYTLPNGTVMHEHEIQLKNRQGTVSITYDWTIHPTDLRVASAITPLALAGELNKAASIEAAAQTSEQPNGRLRERLQFVLKYTTGFESADDPELWLRQYSEYYGWGMPDQAKKDVRVYAWQYETYFPLRSPEEQSSSSGTGLTVAPRSESPLTSPGSRPVFTAISGPALTLRGECFPAGTTVLSISGPKPIETLKPGDRVLAQDIATGELAYKTVQQRTLRRSVKLMNIRCGPRTISATPGHPFWVVGHGWQVAKHLQIGARLRGLEEDTVVDKIEELPPQEVYNLIVSDFATFFVGPQRLFVHDDSLLSETSVLVPGLAVQTEAP
ncbi:MAG: polymorphic toxin-type HINT domain-containing protein [Pirellulales bacterium]